MEKNGIGRIIMEAIKITDSIITSHISTRILPVGYVKIPDGNEVVVGKNINLYDSKTWKLKPLQILVDEGILILKNNEIIENNKIKTLTTYEMYIYGKAEVPDNLIVENGQIRAKTTDELYTTGVIGKEEWNNSKIKLYKELRLSRLRHFGTFIKPMWDGESDGVSYGEITESERVLNETLYRQWLTFQNQESKRHIGRNWDPINYSDVHLGNLELFPELPSFPDDILP